MKYPAKNAIRLRVSVFPMLPSRLLAPIDFMPIQFNVAQSQPRSRIREVLDKNLGLPSIEMICDEFSLCHLNLGRHNHHGFER